MHNENASASTLLGTAQLYHSVRAPERVASVCADATFEGEACTVVRCECATRHMVVILRILLLVKGQPDWEDREWSGRQLFSPSARSPDFDSRGCFKLLTSTTGTTDALLPHRPPPQPPSEIIIIIIGNAERHDERIC